MDGMARTPGGLIVPRLRAVVAWDWWRFLSHLAAAKTELPLPHPLAKTFQQLHVRWVIERLGLRRGPPGRQQRLRGSLKIARRGKDEQDYLDEISSLTAEVTADEGFWKGISPQFVPWRFLAVQGQEPEMWGQEGHDTLPGRLADAVLTRAAALNEWAVERRTGRERIVFDSELQAAAQAEEGEDAPESGLAALGQEDEELEALLTLHGLRDIPGYEAWHMHEILGMTQDEIARELGCTQAWVSKQIKRFRHEALRRLRQS